MSGPKAVIVISREERIARCESLMVVLDAQVSEWFRVCEKYGIADEGEKLAVREKVALLRNRVEGDKFDEFERQTPIVIEYLRRDVEERIGQQAEKSRQKKTTQRRLGIAAAQVLEMSVAAGHEVELSIRRNLEAAAAGLIGDPAEVERSLNVVIAAMSKSDAPKPLSDEHRRLAISLKGGQKGQTVSDWVISNPQFDDDLATRVDGYVADLEVMEDAVVAAPFSERMHEIRAISDQGRRRMLLDTLIIDLAAEVKDRKYKRSLYLRAVSLKALLEHDEEVSHQQSAKRISDLITDWANTDLAKAERIVKKVAVYIDQEQRKRNAKCRRTAMLEAFSELGYEIREGLETAWVTENRIVVRKSEQQGHGVELSGNTENGRLQVRAVKFVSPDANTDRLADIDIETIWCSEFGKLQDILDRNGSALTIEKAKAVGETPVKKVDLPRDGRDRGRSNELLSRKLPKK